jgi:amidohydrolase
MCGHDGHMATLLCTAEVLITNKDKIPNNKTVRLIFQPAEEGPGGALPMIKDECLEGVDEIYGFHNRPMFKEGIIAVKKGVSMASSTRININVHGLGGHGSTPHMVRDVITASAAILCNLHVLKSRMIDSKINCVFTIT